MAFAVKSTCDISTILISLGIHFIVTKHLSQLKNAFSSKFSCKRKFSEIKKAKLPTR